MNIRSDKHEECATRCIHPEDVERIRKDMVDEETLGVLAETFKALGDRTRAKIIYALLTSELCVCDLSQVVGISESAVSHQLRHLRGLRLVKHRREGQKVYYSLDDDHIRGLLGQCLDHARERL
ncbi:MAG: ArsR family transcriptional regulator [Actinobacteria bacterium]|nr:MAG: ArsR family transcriptional regulator [Actinomycetota bacterium]